MIHDTRDVRAASGAIGGNVVNLIAGIAGAIDEGPMGHRPARAVHTILARKARLVTAAAVGGRAGRIDARTATLHER